MKKLLTLFALATCGVLFSPSAMANCYCEQGVMSGDACLVPRNINSSSGSMMPIGRPICPAQSGGQAPTYKKPTLYQSCESRPQGGQACLATLKDGRKVHVSETNAQGVKVYFRTYYADGNTIESEQQYQGNVAHGAFKSYHLNGKPQFLGNYVNGKLHGELKTHDENGRLIKVEHYQNDVEILRTDYQNGKKHGLEVEFGYAQNNPKLPVVIRTAQWVNGVKHGEEQFFEITNKKGKTKLIKTVMWKNGNQVR